MTWITKWTNGDSTVFLCNWIFEEIASVIIWSIRVKSRKRRDRKTKTNCFFFAVVNIRRRKREVVEESEGEIERKWQFHASYSLSLSCLFCCLYKPIYYLPMCFLTPFLISIQRSDQLTIDCHSHQCRIVFEIVSTIHHEFERRSLSICGWEEEETRERERKQTISWQMQTLQREKKIR